MAINIQNLLDALQAKINSADSDMSAVELGKLTKSNRVLSELKNAIAYANSGELPEADEYNQGRILWDSGSQNYVVSTLGRWETIQLNPSPLAIFQGGSYGFSVFRKDTNPGTSELERFPFGSNVTSVNFASIGTTPGSPFSSAKSRVGGGISDVANATGYQTGGFPDGTPPGNIDIFKFNMISGTPVVIYGGTMNTLGRYSVANHTDTKASQGFISSGREPSGPPNPAPYSTICEKFSFTTEAPAIDVGDLSLGRIRATGLTDTINDRAYTVGGQQATAPLAVATRIDQFPFASPFTTSSDVGDIGGQGATWGFSGSSTQNGYVGGGDNNGNAYISKFPFSAPFTTSTQTGNLLQRTVASTTSCSFTDMYIVGGWAASDPIGGINQYSSIDKFSFASENPAVSVATISPVAQAQVPVSHGTGHHY